MIHNIFKASVFASLFSMSAFASNLSDVVMKEQLKDNSNYVFSNASIDGLLSLLGLGFGPSEQQLLVQYWDGESIQSQISKAKSGSVSSPDLVVSINNQIWLDQKFAFLPSFNLEMLTYFGIVPQKMDVSQPTAVADQVNQWAVKNTNNLIKEVVKSDDITSDTVSLFANALYFKGSWEEAFDKNNTVDDEFYGAGQVSTMRKSESSVRVFEPEKNVILVELPFKGGSHSFIIAMPMVITSAGQWESDVYEYDSNGDVQSVFTKYISQGEAFKAIKDNGYNTEFEKFSMPKFEIDSEIKNIQDLLPELAPLFVKGALSNMSDDPNVKLSKIMQKAKIIVNEEGAEAAAVSVGTITFESFHKPLELKINGPFAFAIRDLKNGNTLFEGVITNPK